MNGKMKRKIKISVDVLMLLSFIFTYVSLAFPDTDAHIIAALITIPLIAVHLLLNGQWIKALTKNFFMGKLKKKALIKYFVFVVLLAAFVAAVVTGLSAVSSEGNASRAHSMPSMVFSVFLAAHIFVHAKSFIRKLRKKPKQAEIKHGEEDAESGIK